MCFLRRLAPSIALACGLLVSACQSRSMTINGEAMSPTLNNGDRVAVSTDVRTLERGEIIVFYYPIDPTKTFIKRIVGLPGEIIAIEKGHVMINGKEFAEPYLPETSRSEETTRPTTVAADEYFVMGDYRLNSSDSRSWGTVPRALIWGKVRRP